MSSFTAPITIEAILTQHTGWRRVLPPGLHRPKWRVTASFDYAIGSLHSPSEIITVPKGFEFDGASVPLPFRIFVPMAHPNYIQAAALHDFMLEGPQYTRRYCDLIFKEALQVLGLPRLWVLTMFAAVRLGAYKHAFLTALKRITS